MATKTVASGVDFAAHTETLTNTFMELFPAVSTGEWTTWSLSEQAELRALINLFVETGNGILRPAFDSTVWAGHENGTVDNSIESIRAQRTDNGEKPGRKTPTALEVLNRKLGKTA
jgi:hypothetical protein